MKIRYTNNVDIEDKVRLKMLKENKGITRDDIETILSTVEVAKVSPWIQLIGQVMFGIGVIALMWFIVSVVLIYG